MPAGDRGHPRDGHRWLRSWGDLPVTSAARSTRRHARADAILSFPSIILAMAITAVRGGPGLGTCPDCSGIRPLAGVRAADAEPGPAIRENEFVTAAKSIGADRNRILFRHILPSTDAPIIVKATLDVGAAIVLTAGLSFIGLGAVPPTAEWGAMIKQGPTRVSSTGGTPWSPAWRS